MFLNEGRKRPHTTHSWQFLMLENNNGVIDSSSLWKKARFGEDTILANLDTGSSFNYSLYILLKILIFFVLHSMKN